MNSCNNELNDQSNERSLENHVWSGRRACDLRCRKESNLLAAFKSMDGVISAQSILLVENYERHLENYVWSGRRDCRRGRWDCDMREKRIA